MRTAEERMIGEDSRGEESKEERRIGEQRRGE